MLTLQQSFLLKFPRNAWYKITVSRNLAGFSFPVANQITGHTDFPWKHFLKTTMWRHTMKKIPWYCKFNVLFIWLKIAPVSAWNSTFQISWVFLFENLEVLYWKVSIFTKIRLHHGCVLKISSEIPVQPSSRGPANNDF